MISDSINGIPVAIKDSHLIAVEVRRGQKPMTSAPNTGTKTISVKYGKSKSNYLLSLST